jgi:hypothetical protein
MADLSIHSAIAGAIPVAIGGLLAAGGGIAAQVVTHVLASKREHQTLRRERLEAFVKALFAHDQWLLDKCNIMLFRDQEHDVGSPLDEAQMMQALHFPELTAEVLAIRQKQEPVLNFIWQEKTAKAVNPGHWISTWDAKPYQTARQDYWRTILAATEKCRKLMNERPKGSPPEPS